ncbi:MAG: phosphatidylinositol-specific phospholipase C/glycerophosphodiester phosphodiesterase family protein [Actinomycetota bacterium]
MLFSRRPLRILVTALAVSFAAIPSDSSALAKKEVPQTDVYGLERAHAHNDYEHERPLFDALDRGFKSVEADVWLVDGELLVAHDREDVVPGRTLESLYLKPLHNIVRRNRGSVYPGDDDYFTLLVDIKSGAVPTYLVLHEKLQRHKKMLTTFTPGGVRDGAITVIVSGNRPRELMERQRMRYAAYDGRLSDLGVATGQSFSPLISDNWRRHFAWRGAGPISPSEHKKLREIVAEAHANGQRLRFWATPEEPGARENVWRELLEARADYINTDHLDALEEFLLTNDYRSTEPHVYWERHVPGPRSR